MNCDRFDGKRVWGPKPNYASVETYGPHSLGNGMLSIAGPCSIESEEQLETVAKVLKASGVTWLRGGIWKAGTYPPPAVDFGLVSSRLGIIGHIKRRFGLKVVLEVLDVRLLPLLDQYADAFQVGARQMQNYPLLVELGKQSKPVTLKRHHGATLDEFLGAAEYLARGKCQPVLIERGGVSPLNHVRWDLSLSLIAAVKRITRLPILVDASHGTGRRDLVEPMTMAGLAAGADGFLVECHPDPEKSLTDTDQAFPLDRFPTLIERARQIHDQVSQWYGQDSSLSITSSYAWGRHDLKRGPC